MSTLDKPMVRTTRSLRSSLVFLSTSKTKVQRSSCPARLLTELSNDVISQLNVDAAESERESSLNRFSTTETDAALSKFKPEPQPKVNEPPYAPGTKLATPKRGAWKLLDVADARYARFYFSKMFAIFKAPFRTVTSIHDLNNIITLFAFLAVNLLPVHIFSLLVFADYACFVQYMPVGIRILWLQALYYVTWFFVLLYAVNVGRLMATLIIDIPNHLWWIDWEETLYRFIRPRTIAYFRDGADKLWSSYHQRTWHYIRGIQADVCETKQAIHEGCEERGLPPLVEGMIIDFTCLKGANELDYRWYLHDNRDNMHALKELNYQCRETIASYLIPEEAFGLDKDQLLEHYCE